MTRECWRKACAGLVLAVLAWAVPLSAQTVEKSECRMASGDQEQDKADLRSRAKRAAASELYGEAITALTEVEDFSVNRECILSRIAGHIRVQGSPTYRNGDSLGEICVTLSAYATEEDRSKVEQLIDNDALSIPETCGDGTPSRGLRSQKSEADGICRQEWSIKDVKTGEYRKEVTELPCKSLEF